MRVIVIGGGVMGLSCAWRLAERGWAVTVLEGRRCGEGASLAALGALWPPSASNRSAGAQWHRECLQKYPEFLRELTAASQRTVAYKQLGRLEVMTSPEQAKRGRTEVAAANAERRGGADSLRFVEKWEGMELPFGAVRCELTAQVRVAELVAALKAACERSGAVVREGMRVAHMERHGGEWLAAAGAEAFAADRVVVAAGAWSGELGAVGVAVKPVRGQGIALRRGDVNVPCIVKRGPIYVVPWEEEVLVGSTTEEVGFEEGVTEAAREELVRGAEELVPGLKGAGRAEVLRQWAGLRPKGGKGATMGGVGGGVWVCTGHYKTGIGMCGEAGMRVAEGMG